MSVQIRVTAVADLRQSKPRRLSRYSTAKAKPCETRYQRKSFDCPQMTVSNRLTSSPSYFITIIYGEISHFEQIMRPKHFKTIV